MFIRHHVPISTSTNTLALELAQSNASHLTLVTCDTQTQGRGRQGRSWYQDEGGLAFSIILRPPIPIEKASQLTLIAAVALSQALPIQTQIKWPNDLLLRDGRKCIGILTEAYSTEKRLDAVIVGIGINVQRHKNSPIEYGFLSDSGYLQDKTQLIENILPSLESNFNLLDFDTCLNYFKKHSATLGQSYLGGIAIDINPDGSLLIQDRFGNLTATYNL